MRLPSDGKAASVRSSVDSGKIVGNHVPSDCSSADAMRARYEHTKQLDKTFNLLTDLLISGEIERGDYCKRAVTFTFIQPDWDEIQASYIQMISTIAHQLIYEKENLDPLQLVYEAVG
jgi:hypothetical protein